jgi:glycosyltransferase involved in cell wall biosynthesis
MKSVKVSAVYITLNCGDTIEESIKSLLWCDEIVVVDSGSTDNTIEICQKYGCRIYHKDFKGFGEQRQFAVSLAKHDWVICLDGDEVLTPRSQDELKGKFAGGDPGCSGFKIPVRLVFLGRPFRFGKESSYLHLRVFNRQYGTFNNLLVHENAIIRGKIKHLRGLVYHYSYRDIHHFLEKMNGYTSYSCEQLVRRNRHIGITMMIIKIPVTFFVKYVIQLNILNGFPGFVWSSYASYFTFTKYVKVHERYNNMHKS